MLGLKLIHVSKRGREKKNAFLHSSKNQTNIYEYMALCER